MKLTCALRILSSFFFLPFSVFYYFLYFIIPNFSHFYPAHPPLSDFHHFVFPLCAYSQCLYHACFIHLWIPVLDLHSNRAEHIVDRNVSFSLGYIRSIETAFCGIHLFLEDTTLSQAQDGLLPTFRFPSSDSINLPNFIDRNRPMTHTGRWEVTLLKKKEVRSKKKEDKSIEQDKVISHTALRICSVH